jgi:hypothetical protein
MTKTIPSFLRLHHQSNLEQDAATATTAGAAAPKNVVDDFWYAYKEVTGWRIDSPSDPVEANSRVSLAIDESEALGDQVSPAVNKLSAQRLADSANQLAGQLADAYEAMRVQSAELAARSAIVAEEARGAMAEQLTQTLKDAELASRCDALAIYLLDDNTECLTLRGMHGLPAKRIADAPRPLQGSRGDLEAMVRGVVAISDLHELSIDTWNCPESAASAICAAIVNAGVPIGTLWLYFNEKTPLGESQEAIARMAAGSIAVQLQHVAAGSADTPTNAPAGGIEDMAQWQFAGLPMGSQLASDWRVDGMVESPQDWATGWHAWDVLPDGSLMVAMAEAIDSSTAGAMVAAISRAALESHAGYRHTPQQLLQRVSDTLWQTNTMDQVTSMLYVRIDPETGEGEIASAGNQIALIASRYGYRPAVQCSHSPLASQFDLNCTTSTFRLSSGEVLMAYGEGFAADGIDQLTIGNQLRSSMQAGDKNPLASIRRFLADRPMNHERGAVSILRQ